MVVPGGAGLSKSTRVVLGTVKRATTVVSPTRVTGHGPTPEQSPLFQLSKMEPVAGAAVRVTGVF